MLYSVMRDVPVKGAIGESEIYGAPWSVRARSTPAWEISPNLTICSSIYGREHVKVLYHAAVSETV
jgi:hypothetical protein